MMSKGFLIFRKQLPNWGQFIGLFVICAILVIGCNNEPNSVQPPTETAGARITIGTTLKPRTLDPADSYELAGINIIYNVGESLYTYELGTTKLKPLLATEMPTLSEDSLTYTIPLREGVSFHDGTLFNAEAMEFSLKRFMENGGKPSFLLTDIVASVAATGEYELTIKLKQPFSAFPALLAFPGACALSPAAYTLGVGEFNPNQLVGTGQYKLTEFTADSIKLDVFAEYWGEKPANEGIDLQIYAQNSANLFNSFRTGAVDVAYQSLDPEQIKSLQAGAKEGKWQDIEAPGTVVSYLVLNLNQKPLDQLEVRQAIAALLDRNLLIERVLQGQGEPVYSLIPTGFAMYKPAFQEVYGAVNITKAKELLTQAGYSATNPIIIEVWYPSGSTTRSIVAQTLKALAAKELAGAIQFEPKSVEGATAFSNVGKGIYPTFLADWYPDFLDADNYIQPFLSCTQGSQITGCEAGGAQTQGSFYYSDRMNQLIEQQRREQNTETREAIFAEIQATLAQDVPYLPLWQSKDYAFTQNGISGLTINPQSIPFWQISRGNPPV
ncbi:MAG: peptide ABC transporter substrate-binding protein [Gomphosphaeria aponina SAG 52.96 = DSM 107014]|uniref:Peptide ABC transporter substrate-binding protein n=1 Tax=Gomphosphaeria aponina SAG 52.96 = DSM 107014 TaxID=1521640 RepID=A0A941JS78_9CHRO|nr:peptide ABC transporter substrate-binding protein [Gomphosphaeria aponina SAG 52.96 = DSM 107014]